MSPTLFGIFAADLIHHLRQKFPNATILHNGQHLWVGGFLYVDDLCLISTNAQELQAMLDECQKWSTKARMQINAQKSKVMVLDLWYSRRSWPLDGPTSTTTLSLA